MFQTCLHNFYWHFSNENPIQKKKQNTKNIYSAEKVYIRKKKRQPIGWMAYGTGNKLNSCWTYKY